MSSMNTFTTKLVKEHHNADNSNKDSNLVNLVDDDGQLGKEIDIGDMDINSAVTSSSLKVFSPPKHLTKTTNVLTKNSSAKRKSSTATTTQSSTTSKQKSTTPSNTNASTSVSQGKKIIIPIKVLH